MATINRFDPDGKNIIILLQAIDTSNYEIQLLLKDILDQLKKG